MNGAHTIKCVHVVHAYVICILYFVVDKPALYIYMHVILYSVFVACMGMNVYCVRIPGCMRTF